MRKGSKLHSSYLEEYEIISKHASGGNSEVYKVKDSEGNTYALKIINKDSSKEKMKKFKNEMKFCEKNNHKNIIKIIDNGITDDKSQMFFIMPFYEKTLRDFMNENHSVEEKIIVFGGILEGVKFFHKKGIIHRDLKPENILIDVDDTPVISDFEIAHFCVGELETQIETKLDARLANFQYASPEQRERNGNITDKSDIYSLGLILNEMFTKKIPSGNSYKKIGNVEVTASFLDDIVDKMIYQNPQERFKCIEDVIETINVQIGINKRENRIKDLEKIELFSIKEDDILITELPKLVNVDYDDKLENLLLYLDKSVSDEWISCMTKGSFQCLFGYEPERFSFVENIASIELPVHSINLIQKIVDYFKSWIDNANNQYSVYIRNKKNIEIQEKRIAIEKEIERQKQIKEAISKVHL